MRVTSSMMTNNMMLNVNRNMRNLFQLEMQFSSTRRINVPSDNPLIAARHLKFRNNITANEDFQRNVENALAWMDVTESALDGVLQTLLNEIRDVINRAHNDPNPLSARNVLIEQMNHLTNQIGHQMNTRFAGRYVFSGLRTDQPPVFTQDQQHLSYRITQNFSLGDVERTKSLQVIQPSVDTPPGVPRVHDPIHRLKLAFTNVDLAPITDPLHPDFVAGDAPAMGPNITITGSPPGNTNFIVRMRSVDDLDAYDVSWLGADEVIYIPETGELIFRPEDVTGAIGSANFPVEIVYERTGFHRGELNPIVNFNVDLLYAPAGNSLRHLIGQSFNMDNQDMLYEFSTHTTIPTNVLSKNVLTDKLFADLHNLINFIRGIRPSDPALLRSALEAQFPDHTEAEIDAQMTRHFAYETGHINAVMNDRFNNMLFLIDRHASDVRVQVTDIGSRGRRLELMQNRLEQDEGSLERLYTNNIAVDMARLTTLLATAEAAYMASIRVGTNIINITLANFLQV